MVRTTHKKGQAGPATKQQVAAEAWGLMLDFWWGQQGRSFEILRDLGLTPGHMKTLFILQPGEARPIGSLADAVNCDASMATWLVDRLEERGFVERRAQPGDRRVRAIVLTPEGVATRKKLLDRLYDPPEALLALDRATLQTIKDAFAQLPQARPGDTGTPKE
jgi:DNA-binding MarR family transcriptional regulator